VHKIAFAFFRLIKSLLRFSTVHLESSTLHELVD
jgi:hypothetical protein